MKWILSLFRRPTPLEVATRELVDTQLALLRAQTAVEWADAQTGEYMKRIARLSAYVASMSTQTSGRE